MFILIFMHLWNPINIWQIEFVLIWIYSKGSVNRFVVVQHFRCRNICKIVCRVPGKRVKSKFLYQDTDVILLADKCIVVRSFVCRNYDKVLMETGKFSDNLRVTENGLVSVVDRAFKASNSTFQNIGDRLNPLDFDILFLGPPSCILLTRVHDDIKILMPWEWDRFPVFRALAQNIFQFLPVRVLIVVCIRWGLKCTGWSGREVVNRSMITRYSQNPIVTKNLFSVILFSNVPTIYVLSL